MTREEALKHNEDAVSGLADLFEKGSKKKARKYINEMSNIVWSSEYIDDLCRYCLSICLKDYKLEDFKLLCGRLEYYLESHLWSFDCSLTLGSLSVEIENMSLLGLAAAMDRPEHIRWLLEQGDHHVNESVPDCTAVIEDRSKGRRYKISNCSPLAIAIVSGSIDSTSLLAKHPDVRKETDASVCRAAAMDTADVMHEICVNSTFLSDHFEYAFNDAGVFGVVPLQPDEIFSFCSTAQFSAQLKAGFCSRRQAKRIVNELQFSEQEIDKYLALAEHFPKLFSEGPGQTILLKLMVKLKPEEQHNADASVKYDKVLKMLKKTGKGSIDLGVLLGYGVTRSILDSVLSDLSSFKLYFSASDHSFEFCNYIWKDNFTVDLPLLLKSAEVTGPDEDISIEDTLAGYLLFNGDVELCKLAAEKGVFGLFDPRELLELYKEKPVKDSRILPLLLMHKPEAAPDKEV